VRSAELDGQRAAARVPGLGLDGLSNALETHLPLLAVGGQRSDDRHRSLRATIDWSYELLDDHERTMMCTAAIFAAPFDVDAACEVLGRPIPHVVDALGHLVDWNLLSVREGTPTRYRMLETIRQYATERALDAGELDTIRAAHLRWCQATLRKLATRAPGDDHWCAEVDNVADDARAALQWARDRHAQRHDTAGLAETFAAVLFQRGHLGETQRRYEQAAAYTDSRIEQHRLLRFAAGAAAARNVGDETVRLLEQAAALAIDNGEPDDAAEDLAMAAMFHYRASGIMATPATEESIATLLDRARRTSTGSPRARAAIGCAAGWNLESQPHSREATQQALMLAETVDDPLLISAVLDQLIVVELDDGDLEGAVRAGRRRTALVSSMPVDAYGAFEMYDAFHMACRLALAAGELAAARHYADMLAALPFLREERHVGFSRRMEVDAIAGDFASVIEYATLFERDWIRAGRPVASNLAPSAHAAAFTFGILGQTDERARWLDITKALLPSSKPQLAGRAGWAPSLDGLLALHDGDPHGALARMAAAPDDAEAWANPNWRLWLPWYAAAWAEATVLVEHPDVDDRLSRAVVAAQGNPIALTIIERAAALHHRDHQHLPLLADRFERANCPYQANRTRQLLGACG
jgi:hypothetical protein